MNQDLFVPRHLVAAINRYYSDVILKEVHGKNKEWETILLLKGIDIFLKFLPHAFKEDFFAQLHPDIRPFTKKVALWNTIYSDREKMERMVHSFVRKLGRMKGAKIFIGKDAYYLYEKYNILFPQKNDSIFLPYSRKRLFIKTNGNGYFKIVDLIYDSYLRSNKVEEFFSQYKSLLQKDEDLYVNIKIRTLKVLREHHMWSMLQKFNRVCIVDSGTQGGLIMPLKAILEEEGFQCDFALFSCFNWISSFFNSRIYTNDLFQFVLLEHAGIKSYFNKNH